jgi:hypothetical protein
MIDSASLNLFPNGVGTSFRRFIFDSQTITPRITSKSNHLRIGICHLRLARDTAKGIIGNRSSLVKFCLQPFSSVTPEPMTGKFRRFSPSHFLLAQSPMLGFSLSLDYVFISLI